MAHWWQDPSIKSQLNIAFVDTTFLLFGIYVWEYFHTFDVEYAIFRRRLPFRWPLVPYLAGRIGLLIKFLLLVVEMSPSSESIACQSAITCASISAQIVIAASSTNLMIRTWVIWKNSRLMHLFLSLLTLGQWALLISDEMNIKSSMSNGVCVIHISHPAVSAGVFVYTTCYDFIVLVLSVVKLSKHPSTFPLKDRLYTQGIFYFTVAAFANVFPMVFAFLGSPEMTNITSDVAMTASTIVSCRVVRSLLDLQTSQESDTCTQNVDVDTNALTTPLPSQTSITSVCA